MNSGLDLLANFISSTISISFSILARRNKFMQMANSPLNRHPLLNKRILLWTQRGKMIGILILLSIPKNYIFCHSPIDIWFHCLYLETKAFVIILSIFFAYRMCRSVQAYWLQNEKIPTLLATTLVLHEVINMSIHGCMGIPESSHHH